METLKIESTERTPEIFFDYDSHHFEIRGEAYPENSDEFFRPIMEALQEYISAGASEKISFFNIFLSSPIKLWLLSS